MVIGGWLQTDSGILHFELLIALSIIWKTIKSATSTTGGNFDEFKIGRAA
jgi:hypothetical protein